MSVASEHGTSTPGTLREQRRPRARRRRGTRLSPPSPQPFPRARGTRTPTETRQRLRRRKGQCLPHSRTTSVRPSRLREQLIPRARCGSPRRSSSGAGRQPDGGPALASEALARAPERTLEGAKALHTAGSLAAVQQDHAEARQLVSESLTLASSLGEWRWREGSVRQRWATARGGLVAGEEAVQSRLKCGCC
jgi:hypothetical protein